jgi:hypothetical protein
MIPMADNLNHSHATCVNETIHKTFQSIFETKKPWGGAPRKYFTRDKFMNDYSQIYSEVEIAKNPVNILGGRFSRDNFNKNIEKYSLKTWMAEFERDVSFWEMTFKEEDWDEDNDTEEDEEDEEEDSEQHFEKILAASLNPAKHLEGRLAQLINPKKGFKFFIEQEQKMLETLEKK